MCVKPLFVSALDEADIALLKTYVSTSSTYQYIIQELTFVFWFIVVVNYNQTIGQKQFL